MELAADKHQMYRELARRIVAHQPTAQIARQLDRTPATIRKWMRDARFQAILKDMDEQVWQHVMEELRETASESIFTRAQDDMLSAYEVLQDIMEDPKTNANLRAKCANDILEIGGAKKRAEQSTEKKLSLPIVQFNILGETIRQVHNGRHDGKTASFDTDSGGSVENAEDRRPN